MQRSIWTTDLANYASQGVSYLVQDILLEGGLTVFYGPSGHKKTFALMDMALAIATDTQYAGKFETVPKTVLWIDMELDAPMYFERLNALLRGRGQTLEAIAQKHAYCAFPPLNLAFNKTQTYKNSLLWLGKEIDEKKAGIVFLDSLTALCGGANQNDSTLSGALQPLKTMAHEKGITFVLTHHCNKSDPTVERGSGVIANIADAMINVESDNGNTFFSTPGKVRHKPVDITLSFSMQTDENQNLLACGFMAQDSTLDSRARTNAKSQQKEASYKAFVKHANELLLANGFLSRKDIADSVVSAKIAGRSTAFKLINEALERKDLFETNGLIAPVWTDSLQQQHAKMIDDFENSLQQSTVQDSPT